MKKLLLITGLAEVATGLVLLVYPPIVVRLLFGANLAGLAGLDDLAAVGVVIGRVTGIALIALGIACWPGRTALCGMLTYNTLVTAYLACLGLGGEWVGPLLWPAVGLHGVMAILLGRVWLRRPKTGNHQAGE